ncbi:winged helix-turn-helix domain-containing protein [Streptosporangium sp. NBC_01756]|uniref:winged helix-turn-helix domain-containing protein n=1 Tax=Streptosporangium sp. NBC_01756 TaxID=2975950 RepID=UPI002DDA5266|nr:crosslink repair DNA glycosylase YcaQ family protein [Streptosporangium sp. NBC_01756]WSC89605.1 winged helix DNA-binding domain-containing protein [Streptosporangium sp. NBC_01756]
MPFPLILGAESARRLAVSCQHLAGPQPGGDLEGLRQVLRTLRCLQLDPVNVVARSHLLVLWSRVGDYDPADLDMLLWEERWLFEYWAHAASIVLTEDYPIHQAMMLGYPAGRSGFGRRARDWLEANGGLRQHVLDRLREAGPLPAQAFDDCVTVPWESSGWTHGRNVERMVDFLWLQGQLMVAGREGRRRRWDLAERWLPEWAGSEPLPQEEAVSRAAEHALRALGVARATDIERHFTRDRYPGLAEVLERLERSGRVLPAQVAGGTERWYVHRDVIGLLERDWEPRTTLLSPFDNLICDRERTERLWGFTFRTEMYVPKDKRQYGHYILPILHGERLIGRLVPRLDRRRGLLEIEGVFPEAETPADEVTAEAVGRAVTELGAFVGAREIFYGDKVAEPWRTALQAVGVTG